MATLDDRLFEVKEEFTILSATFRTLMSTCSCYHANRLFSRCRAPEPLCLMMLTHRFFVPRQLTFYSPSPISLVSSGSGSPSPTVPNSDSSHNSGDTLPIHISSIPPSLQMGFEVPQPSLSNSVSLLETPMLEDVSSESDGDSRGELWETPPSGGVGEDSV